MINDTKMAFEQKVNTIDKKVFETINFMLELFRKVSFTKISVERALARIPVYLTSHRSTLSNQPIVLKKLINTEVIKAGIQQTYERGSNFAAQMKTAYTNRQMNSNSKDPLQEKQEVSKSNDIMNVEKSETLFDASTEISPASLSPSSVVEFKTEPVDQLSLKDDGNLLIEIPATISNRISIPNTNFDSEGPKTPISMEIAEVELSPQENIPVEHAMLVPLTKCRMFLRTLLTAYSCAENNTRAMVVSTSTPVFSPTDILHASSFVEGLVGFGTTRDLTESLKVIHPPTVDFDAGSDFNVKNVVDAVNNLASSSSITSVSMSVREAMSNPGISAVSNSVRELGTSSMNAAQNAAQYTVNVFENSPLIKSIAIRFAPRESTTKD